MLSAVDTFIYFQNYTNMKTDIVIKALAALAQESRLAIFRLLVQVGPEGLSAGKIGEELSIPSATLSFHLKELSHAELLTSRQESRFIIYTANYQAMNALVSFLSENCCGGRPCKPPASSTRKKRK